jgi:putative transposase
MPLKDAPIEKLMREVIGNSRRGRGKVISLIQRINGSISSSKIRRIYEQKGFALMKRHKRRLRNNPPNPATVPLAANVEWAIDFMHDSLVNGRQIRSLNILDPFNRQCKGVFIYHSIPAIRVIECLERAIEVYGKPKFIRSDNGPEFISKQFQKWMHDNKIGWTPIEKGKPQQNCFVERFNRTIREDFFNANLFFTVEDTQHQASMWKEEYNYLRPHESLNNKTPIEYAA